MSKKRVARIIIAVLLVPVMLIACGKKGGGGGGSGGSNPPPDSAVVQGVLSLPPSSAESPTDYVVYNSLQSVTPAANGNVAIAVSRLGLTVTYAASKSSKRVYSATTTGAGESVNINARSTAETLVLLNPLLIPGTAEEQARIISQVRSDSAVSALASVIETVYGTAADPLSDPRILEAARDATLSVLNALSVSTSSASTISSVRVVPVTSPSLRRAFSTVSPTALSTTDGCAGDVPPIGSMYICAPMTPLDLGTSSGTTLRVVQEDVGPFGISTNVDWVVEIIELDSSKLQWTQSGKLALSILDLSSPARIEDLAKVGGKPETLIVEGEIASGGLGDALDPIGKLAEFIGGRAFPKNGNVLPGSGVYAVVALSGSPGRFFGQYAVADAAEYDSVKSSPRQRALWQKALTINIIKAALDMVDVGMTIASAGVADTDLILEPVILATYPLILTKVQTAEDHGVAFLSEAIGIVVEKLTDALSGSAFQATATKSFLSAPLKVFKSGFDVLAGSISVGTRAVNFLKDVSPREVGYVVVGAPNAVLDQVAPSTPTGLTVALFSTTRVSLAWNASTDNVSVAGYRLYRNGARQEEAEATTSRIDVVPSGNAQYCYEITAYDATGNESARSSARCVTQTQATPPATPGSFAASSQTQGSITLGWLDNSDNETGFKIERKVGTGGSFVQIAPIGPLAGIGSGGSYKDSDLVAGTTNCYRLRAYNLIGDSSFTGESCATAQAGTLPMPGSFILSNDSPVCDLNSPTVLIKWGASSDATTYDVYRNGVLYKPTTGTSFNNIANLFAGQSYTYQVVAKNFSGSTPSNTISVLIPASICQTTPPASFTLSGSAQCNGSSPQILLSGWGASGATTFDVYRNGSLLFPANTGSTFLNTSVTAGTTYSYYVVAKNASGSTISSTISVTADTNCGGTPTLADLVPQNIIVDPNLATAGGTVTVSYIVANTGGTNAPASHTRVQIKSSSAVTIADQTFLTSSILANSSVSESHSMSLAGAASGTYYAYVIVDTQSEVTQSSTSNDGQNNPGAAFTVQTEATTPTAPSGLVALAASSFMSLAWNDNSSDETGFMVERKTGVSGSWSQISSVGQNIAAYLDYGVSAGITYFYRVFAYNASGGSGYSNEASVTIAAALTVNGIASSYTATSGTYQPTISLSGSGFSSIVNQIYFTCVRNGISCGNYTWTSANWSGKYIVYNDSSAVIAPVLTVSTDPAGTYNWTVTFSGADVTPVTKSFAVTKN